MLSQKEIEQRGKLIKDGVKECKKLIGKQTSESMYFFYEGSIDGFEECENLNTLESYVERIQELFKAEAREIAWSLKGDTEERRLLKEELQVYGDRKMDLDKVWRLKGIRTQINFVYENLMAYKLIYNLIKDEAIKQGLNLEAKF